MKPLIKPFLATIAFCAAVVSGPAHAIFGIGDIVIDPINLVQNTYSAVAAVKNEVNTAAAYIKQIEQALALAKSLKSVNGLATLAGVQQELALYSQLKNTSTQLASIMDQSLKLSQNVQAQYGASNVDWTSFLTSRSAVDRGRSQVLAAQYATIDQSMVDVAQRRQAIVSQLQDSSGQTSAMQSVGAGIDVLIGQNQLMVSTLSAQGKVAIVKQNTDDASGAASLQALKDHQQQLIDAANKYH